MNAQTLARFVRPEYVYQPVKIIRRLFSKGLKRGGKKIVDLPWKISMEVDTSEIIGYGIAHTGIFEIPVVEAIFRLLDSGDTVLDVGANVGYMSAAALSAGAGRVIAFEPHPILFARLLRNVARWDREPRYAGRVSARHEAIDSETGRATLYISMQDFSGNQGIATLESQNNPAACERIEVASTTLDSVIAEVRGTIGLLKIDIEGHEFQAFNGAGDSLRSKKIRNIVYECIAGADAPASRLLASYGYSIFGLHGSLRGPVLREHLKTGTLPLGDHNLLATLDPERAKQRMTPRGYKCLSLQARRGNFRRWDL